MTAKLPAQKGSKPARTSRGLGNGQAGRAARSVEPDAERAIDLVMKLMAIPGGSGDEAAVAAAISGELRKAGAPASAIKIDRANRRASIRGNVGNLILRLPGTIRAPRRMLSAHMDTVPICLGARPVRKGSRIVSADPSTGLGGDNRAGCAVLLVAALEILRRGLPHPPLTCLWTIQEETGLEGARHVQVAALGRPQLAFNFDGGAPQKLTIGATGGYRMTIDITGLASHAGAAPQEGVSAIAIAALAIADLQREGWHGRIEKDGTYGTSNVGVIQGGNATNVVTDRVRLRAEARSHDPKFRRRIVRQFEQAFRQAARSVKSAAGRSGSVEFDGKLDYEAFRLAADDPSIVAAEAAVRDAGLVPEHAISDGGLDANWLAVNGIKAVTLGCGQKDIHTASEQLDVPQFVDACRIGLRLALGAGG